MTVFDLNRFKSHRQAGTTTTPKVRTPTPKSKDRPFVQLDYERTLVVAGKLQNAHLAVLIELAYQSFKTHRNTVLLPNTRFRSVGISPDAKVRALRQLEAIGMISADWRGGRKTPLVTLLRI